MLSPEGRLLLAYADRLLHLSSEAEAAVRSSAPCGTLRIGTLESTAATRLPPVLSHYHRAYPDVQIELVTGTSGALVSRVLDHDIEAAFVAEPFATSGLDPGNEGAAIRVHDIHRAKEELESRGVTIGNWRVDEREGNRLQVFFVVAPDGLCFYFHQPIGD